MNKSEVKKCQRCEFLATCALPPEDCKIPEEGHHVQMFLALEEPDDTGNDGVWRGGGT